MSYDIIWRDLLDASGKSDKSVQKEAHMCIALDTKHPWDVAYTVFLW